MFKKQPWLRFIEGTDGNAAGDAGDHQDQANHDAQTTDDGEDVDYKAKYEAMKAHSRDWESKAKANLEAAKKLKELEDAEKSEAYKLQDRLAESEKANAGLHLSMDRMTITAKFGLSAEDAQMFLHGEGETMTAQAEALAGNFRPQRHAETPNQGLG